MTTKTRMLPFFVYGTLRPGEGNHSGFVTPYGRTEHDDVKVNGFDMFLGGGFPYIVDADDDSVVTGTLIEFYPEDFAKALEGLDFLEGYHDDPTYKYGNHYDRRVVTVDLNGEKVEAYTYVASANTASRITRTLPKSASGDWRNNRAELRAIKGEREPYVTFRELFAMQNGN